MRIFPYATFLAFIIVLRHGFDILRTFLVKSKINKYAALSSWSLVLMNINITAFKTGFEK